MLHNVTFSQVDKTDEIAREFNRVIDNVNQMQTKICQLSNAVDTLAANQKLDDEDKILQALADEHAVKPKSKVKKEVKKKTKKRTKPKGNIQMRTLGVIALIAVIIGFGGMTYAQYRPMDINYDVASNPDLLSRYLRDVIGTTMAGDSYIFNPRADAPLAIEGRIYYNSGSNEWIGYKDTGWTTFAVAAGTSLDAAYSLGQTITIDSGPVILAAADGEDDIALTITQGDTNATTPAMTITHAGAAAGYISIDIDSQAAGRDIEGTNADWYVSGTGVITAASAVFGAAGITLVQGETITNPAGKITFTDVGDSTNTLVFDLNAGANAVQLESNNATEFQFGTVDDLTEIGTIVFDTSEIASITADGGAGEDFTVTYAGGAAASLILHSDGTGVNAVIISSTHVDGGIDIDANNDIAITVTSSGADEDLLLTQTGGQLSGIILTSSGIGTSAIKLETTSATGDIWIDAGNDLIIDIDGLYDLDLVGILDIDTDAAITIDNTAGDISIDSAAGSLNLTGGEAAVGAITLTTSNIAGTIVINSAATTGDGIDIDSDGGIDIDAADTIAIDNSAGDISIDSAAGIVDIDAELEITIDNAGAGNNISIDSDAGSLNLTGGQAAEDAVVITSGGGMDIILVDDFDLTVTADGADEDLTITLAGGQDAQLVIQSDGTGADALDFDTTAGGMTFDIAGAAADEDFAVTTNTSVTFTTAEAVANQFYVIAGGTHAGVVVNFETTRGGILLHANHADDGDIQLDAEDVMTFTSVDYKMFDGANTEVWRIDGSVGGTYHSISFTDATANIIWTFPDGVAGTYGIMQTSLATNFVDVSHSVTGGSSEIIFEGSNEDTEETIIRATDPTADIIWLLANGLTDTLAFMGSTLETNYPHIDDSVWFGANTIYFEGTTEDAVETLIVAADPTGGIVTWTLPDAGGATSISFMGSTLATNMIDVVDSVWGGTNSIIFEGGTADGIEAIIQSATITTGTVTWMLPDLAFGDTLAFMASTLVTNAPEISDSVWFEANTIVFEDAPDDYETRILASDPLQDITWTLPTVATLQTVSFMASTLATNFPEVADSVTGGTGSLIFEGATANANETTITSADVTADMDWVLPLAAATQDISFVCSTLLTNMVDVADSVWMESNGIRFEGGAVNAFESVITSATITGGVVQWMLPDMGGDDILAFMASTMVTNAPEIVDSVWFEANTIVFEDNADDEETRVTAADPLDDITWMIPTLASAPDATVAFMASTLVTNYPQVADSVWCEANQLVFEGSSDNTEETIIEAIDATADNIIYLPAEFSGNFMIAGTNSEVYTRVVELTAGNIQNLAASPIELVPTPGADYGLKLLSCLLILDVGGTPFADAAGNGNMYISYINAGGLKATGSIEGDDFIDCGADFIIAVEPADITATAVTSIENDALVLYNDGTEYTTGDGTMTVFIEYAIVKLGLL